MNSYLIATQGVTGSSLAIAVQGFSTIDDVVVVPYVPTQYGSGGSVSKYFSKRSQSYEIPVLDTDESEEELIVASIILEIAKNELN
jgi:hypothetical protein